MSPSAKMDLVGQLKESSAGSALVQQLFGVQDANRAPIDTDRLAEDDKVCGILSYLLSQ